MMSVCCLLCVLMVVVLVGMIVVCGVEDVSVGFEGSGVDLVGGGFDDGGFGVGMGGVGDGGDELLFEMEDEGDFWVFWVSGCFVYSVSEVIDLVVVIDLFMFVIDVVGVG